MNINIREDVENYYLEWVNNFLTIEKFAEYYKITEVQAKFLIDMGKQINSQKGSALIDNGF